MMPYFTDQKESGSAGFAHPSSHAAEMCVAPGMIVADFGSGSGSHVFPLAVGVGHKGRVYAIDVQRDLLTRIKNEATRRGLHHVDVLWGDLEMPGGSKIADGHVDVVLGSNILFQLSDKHTALAEARRILKPAGSLVVIERSGVPGIYRGNTLSRDEIFALARRADFEPVREFDAGSHHWGVVFRPVAFDLTQRL